MGVKDRIKAFASYKCLTPKEFEQMCELSNGAFSKINDNIRPKTVDRISIAFPELNREWLLTGNGEMLLPEEEQTVPAAYVDALSDRGIPYYEELPVSAGQLEVLLQSSKPTGYINIPGLRAQALFPVVGCSMKPEINPGDVVGVEALNNWDSIDPDKVYMIITSDDRMIKHLELDDEDGEILWCVSPNYKRFKIAKSNIKATYRICYVGKLM